MKFPSLAQLTQPICVSPSVAPIAQQAPIQFYWRQRHLAASIRSNTESRVCVIRVSCVNYVLDYNWHNALHLFPVSNGVERLIEILFKGVDTGSRSIRRFKINSMW